MSICHLIPISTNMGQMTVPGQAHNENLEDGAVGTGTDGGCPACSHCPGTPSRGGFHVSTLFLERRALVDCLPFPCMKSHV